MVETPFPAGAVLRIACTHHDDQILVEHCISADGTEFWDRNRNGLTTALIAPSLSPEAEQKVLETFGGGLPTPPGDPDEPPHLKYRFTCPKPSCSYDRKVNMGGPVEGGHYIAVVHRSLRHMLAMGLAHATVTVERLGVSR